MEQPLRGGSGARAGIAAAAVLIAAVAAVVLVVWLALARGGGERPQLTTPAATR